MTRISLHKRKTRAGDDSALAGETKGQFPSRRSGRRGAFPIKSKGPIIALDWDGEVLRVAQSIQRGGKAEVNGLAVAQVGATLAVGKDDPQVCGARLAKALAGLKLKPGAVVMAVSRGLVFLRTLWLPKSRTSDEMASMVHFQISKDLPFHAEEAVIDFQVNPSPRPVAPGANGEAAAGGPPATEKVEVLVAVVKREVVQFYERLAEAAGFRLAALSLDSYANARALSACGLDGQSRIMALVSLRSQEVTIDVIAAGELAFSRTASLAREPVETPVPLPAVAAPPRHESSASTPGRQAAGSEAAALEDITIEVVRSLHSFEGLDSHGKIGEILVTGDAPRTAGSAAGEAVAERLSRSCQLPCRRLDPPRAPGATPTGAEADQGMLLVWSLAVMAQDVTPWSFDFLHPKRPAVPRNMRRIRILSTAAAVVFLLGLALGIRAHLLHQRLAARNQVSAEIDLAAKNRPLYRQMRLRAKTVHDWMLDRREWLDHYARLSALLPDCSEVYITSFSTGGNGVLHLSIRARSGEVLAQIDKSLRAAGYDLKPLAVTPASDRYGYAFQSSLELTLPETMKVDLAALKAPPRPPDDGSLEPGGSSTAVAAPPSRPAPGGANAGRPHRRRNQP